MVDELRAPRVMDDPRIATSPISPLSRGSIT